MEAAKWAALALCLQKAQVDIAEATQEKDKQTKLMSEANAKVLRLSDHAADCGAPGHLR